MARLDWNAERDGWLRRLRTEKCGWAEIAAALGVTPDAARERGRRIGAPAPPAAARIPREDPSRPPLPAGHPRAWGMLVAGTVLDGAVWPGWD